MARPRFFLCRVTSFLQLAARGGVISELFVSDMQEREIR